MKGKTSRLFLQKYKKNIPLIENSKVIFIYQGTAICQSGAFIFPQMPSKMNIDTIIKRFCKKIQFNKLHTTKLWLDCGNIGSLEQFLLKGNRHLHKLLNEKKIEHHYSEANEAHNWKNWAKQMEKALPYMFGR